MSNGLEKFVEEQARFVSDTQADQFKLAYNRGIMDLVRKRELEMIRGAEQPTMFGGGSKVGPISEGMKPLKPLPGNNGIDYSTLVTGGKISRLKKAKKWAAFSGDTLDKGLDLATKAKALGGDLDGGKKKRKSKSSVAAARDWTQFASDALTTGLDKSKEVQAALDRGKKKRKPKGPSVSDARDWASFASDTISTGIDKGKQVQAALDGGKKKKGSKIKQAGKWVDFAVSTANQGLDLAQKAKGITGAGKPRAPNAWVAHVKKYAADHKVTYKEAMSQSKDSYNK